MNGPLGRAGLWLVGVTVAALVIATLLAKDPTARWVASVGVAVAAASGVLALWMKRRAIDRNLNEVLKALGLVFAVRLVLVAVGVLWASRQYAASMAFVVGFFGEYFALQWVEISYVLAETKRRGPGGV